MIGSRGAQAEVLVGSGSAAANRNCWLSVKSYSRRVTCQTIWMMMRGVNGLGG